MRKPILLPLAALFAFQIEAQAVNLRGKVANKQGKGLANAIVTLTPQGLADTTGPDGSYAITGPTSTGPGLSSGGPGATFADGILSVNLDRPSPLVVDIFDARGTRLRTERQERASAGIHRWDIEKMLPGGRVLWIKASFGKETATFRHDRSPFDLGEKPSVADATAPGGLAKAAADPDSLRVRAQGFVTKSIALTSLDATVDVTLDSVPSGPGMKNPPAPSAGCGKTPTLANGSRTLQVGSQNRSYTLRIPANYDRTHPYPLVFAFHWNGGTMGDVDGGGTSGYTWSYYGIREKADKSTDAKMIFVAPQGIGNGWANSGSGGGQDLALVDELLKLLKGDLCVDTTRVFSMGFSYGGGMTYAIACARAKVFRAAAVYAGAQLSGCTDGTQPIAYIGFHGLRDQTCRIEGGRTLRDRFVKNNSCPAQTVPEPAANSLQHTCTSYTGCNAAYPVRWCAFDGAGHSPAPVDGSTSDSGGGDRTWTKDEAWNFFTQF